MQTLPKAQRAQGLHANTKITAFESCQVGQNPASESPNFNFKISTEPQLQNLDQTLVSQSVSESVSDKGRQYDRTWDR